MLKRKRHVETVQELLNEHLITSLVKVITGYLHPRVVLLYDNSHVVTAPDITEFQQHQITHNHHEDIQDLCIQNNELLFVTKECNIIRRRGIFHPEYVYPSIQM